MREQDISREILAGMGTLVISHIVAIPAFIFIGLLVVSVDSATLGLITEPYAGVLAIAWPIAAFSLNQVLYVIPMGFRLYKKRKFNRLKGLIIAAILSVLLNGTCLLVTGTG